MSTIREKRKVICLLFLCILLTLATGCSQPDRLVLESPGQVEKIITLGTSRTFSLRYIHSVEKTPVIEYFEILDDGKLLLTATDYQSYGVGLPSLPDEGHLVVSNGWLRLDNLHRVFQDIKVRVGPEAAVSVEVDKKTYPIYQWYPAGSLVVIRQDLKK